jgi:hypothetical protein
MAEVVIEKTTVPEDLEPPDNQPEDSPSEEAPYGYLADGVTPRKKPGRKPGSGGGSSGGGKSKSLSSLKEPLTQRLVEYCGAPLALASPLAFSYWEMRAEKTADALITIAARSPRTRKWIERLITGSATSDIGITLAGVGTAFLVDTGKVDPGGKIPSYFGLDNLYVELYGSWQEAASDNGRARGLYAEVQ